MRSSSPRPPRAPAGWPLAAPARAPRYWAAFGVTVALGAYAKYSMLLPVAGIAAGFLATPQRRVLRSPYALYSAAIALILLSPNLTWQWTHGWPIVEVLRGDFAHRHGRSRSDEHIPLTRSQRRVTVRDRGRRECRVDDPLSCCHPSDREREFVDAARALGASDLRIMFREILPNLTAPIIVYASLLIPTNILIEAALSYLGVGIRPPTASWGQMIASATPIFNTAWWYMVFPGTALLLTVLAFNLLGDGLRDALNPRNAR